MPGALAGLRAAGGPMECIATADVSQQFAALKVSLGEGICKTHLPSVAGRSGCGGRLMAASAVGSIDTNVEQSKQMQTGCVKNVWALLKRNEKYAEKECATNKLERTQAAVRAALKVPEMCLDLAWRRVRRRGGAVLRAYVLTCGDQSRTRGEAETSSTMLCISDRYFYK